MGNRPDLSCRKEKSQISNGMSTPSNAARVAQATSKSVEWSMRGRTVNESSFSLSTYIYICRV